MAHFQHTLISSVSSFQTNNPADTAANTSTNTATNIPDMTFTLTLGDIAIEEVRQQILAPLVAYNASQAGPSNGRPLVITVTNSEKEVIGGLWGTTGYEWLFTQLLVVPPSARGAGLGTHLMQRAENEAIARGCKGAWLDTFEFQARGFYERLGYECFGEIPNYPTGYSRFFMRKTLSANVAI